MIKFIWCYVIRLHLLCFYIKYNMKFFLKLDIGNVMFLITSKSRKRCLSTLICILRQPLNRIKLETFCPSMSHTCLLFLRCDILTRSNFLITNCFIYRVVTWSSNTNKRFKLAQCCWKLWTFREVWIWSVISSQEFYHKSFDKTRPSLASWLLKELQDVFSYRPPGIKKTVIKCNGDMKDI